MFKIIPTVIAFLRQIRHYANVSFVAVHLQMLWLCNIFCNCSSRKRNCFALNDAMRADLLLKWQKGKGFTVKIFVGYAALVHYCIGCNAIARLSNGTDVGNDKIVISLQQRTMCVSVY